MTTDAIATPFLTAAEVDELCAPLTQRHAQNRSLCILGSIVQPGPKRSRITIVLIIGK